MTEKICPNGHVYVGNRCERDNWQEPVEEVKVPESSAQENPATTQNPPIKPKKTAKTKKVEETKKPIKKSKKSKK